MAVIERGAPAALGGLGRGHLLIEGARFEIERGGPGDNVSALLERLRAQPARRGRAKEHAPQPDPVMMREARCAPATPATGAVVVEGLMDLTAGQGAGGRGRRLAGIVRLRGGDSDPKFGAGRVRVVDAAAGPAPAARAHWR